MMNRSSAARTVRVTAWSEGCLFAERLEARLVLASGIGFDRGTRTVVITGSSGNDVAEVRQLGSSVVISLATADGRSSRTIAASSVARIAFTGLSGDDTFTNLTGVPSRADGGPGMDLLRGGRAADELIGGDDGDVLRGGAGNDRLVGGSGRDELLGDEGADALWGGVGGDSMHGGRGNDGVFGEDGDDVLHGGGENDAVIGGKGGDELFGGPGSDSLDAGEGDDRLDGERGSDRLVGGDGLDREVDVQDRFVDGDDDGDGFDNDYDYADILSENGNPSAYAADATVAPIIEAVSARLGQVLGIAADDPGLRVRVAREQFGELVTGTWRYLTPDKIQVWAKWCYPAADPTRVELFAQYQYVGPFTGDIADYTDPANYVLSEESRLYAGYLSGATMFVGWIAGAAAGFSYSAPGEQATGFPAPIGPLGDALASLPTVEIVGETFHGTFSAAPGFQGVQPVLDLLRTINRVNRTWYARLRAERLAARTG